MGKNGNTPKKNIAKLAIILGGAAVVAATVFVFFTMRDSKELAPYNQMSAIVESGNVKSAKVNLTASTVTLEVVDEQNPNGKPVTGGWPPDGIESLVDELRGRGIETVVEPRETGGGIPLLTFMLIGFALYMVLSLNRKMNPGGTSGRGNNPSEVPTTKFSDVIGCDEAVEELREVTKFLQDPEAFSALGARMPKGFLLVGPPGTGKTLLARACAGEAGVPFYAMSASDFVEIYVGMGASRVRKLFSRARKHGRAIVFIDELDSVGKARGRQGANAASDEHESTLNALLVEMDGFHDSNVIVLAATNRPDVLDSALRRPGRFDRTVFVPVPDRGGREQLLAHYLQEKKAGDVNLVGWAKRTPGMTGAEIEAVCNDAALEAARRGLDKINDSCLEAAVTTAYMGRERRSAVVSDRDRQTTAVHEAGHAVVALVLPDAPDPVSVSVVPRGPAGGATWMGGSDNQLVTQREATAQLAVLLAGRASEQLLLGDVTQGAVDDISKATELAGSMIREWGMGSLGPIRVDGRVPLGDLMDAAGSEEKALLDDALNRASRVLSEHRTLVEAVSAALLERETLDRDDLLALRVAVTNDASEVEPSAAT